MILLKNSVEQTHLCPVRGDADGTQAAPAQATGRLDGYIASWRRPFAPDCPCGPVVSHRLGHRMSSQGTGLEQSMLVPCTRPLLRPLRLKVVGGWWSVARRVTAHNHVQGMQVCLNSVR